MSVVCTIAMALALELSGCETPQASIQLPAEDLATYNYTAPKPEPAQPDTAPAPIETVREIIREVRVEVPVIAPVPEQPPAPDPEPAAKPDQSFVLAKTQLQDIYAARRASVGIRSINGIEKASALLPDMGNNKSMAGATADNIPAFTPPAALDLPGDLANLAAAEEAAKYQHAALTSSLPVDNKRIIAADRYITGILESSINTQVSGDGQGSIIIQTSRDIFGYHGRSILLPKGSRLICDYEAPKKIGETRIPITCNRAVLAGHRVEIYGLKAPVRDAQGRAGIAGEVDNRFWNRYGTAFMLAGISATVRGATASASNTARDRNDAIIDEAGKELAERFGEITASVLQETINLKPVISVPQGTRVQIRPAADWYIKRVS